MNVLAKNLEILLMHHDLVMVPGLGGFVVDYRQAQFDENEQDLMVPPARFVVFNKELNVNDGLMVSAYMQNYDANYPQAYRQLELDVEQLVSQLDIDGWVCLDNVGTLRKNIEGVLSFEQIHHTAITPSLFALAPVRIKTVAQLQNESDITLNIQQTSMLPVAEQEDHAATLLTRKRRWKDIGISSAAAVALFFMFAFPYLRNNQKSDKIIAGAVVTQSVETENNSVTQNSAHEAEPQRVSHQDSQPVQPQIIVLQAPASNQNAIVISQQDINNSANIASSDGKYSIVVSMAANEECAQYVIDQMAQQNLPGAFYYERENLKYILYSRFNSRQDALKALSALKPVNKRFRKSWVVEI